MSFMTLGNGVCCFIKIEMIKLLYTQWLCENLDSLILLLNALQCGYHYLICTSLKP